jgi:hypothetical protein
MPGRTQTSCGVCLITVFRTAARVDWIFYGQVGGPAVAVSDANTLWNVSHCRFRDDCSCGLEISYASGETGGRRIGPTQFVGCVL